MPTYRAKPHTIQAIRLELPFKGVAPDWLLAAYNKGKVMTVCNAKDKYMTIWNADGMRKAFPGDWVCLNAQGTIFPLSNGEFEEGFESCE